LSVDERDVLNDAGSLIQRVAGMIPAGPDEIPRKSSPRRK